MIIHYAPNQNSDRVLCGHFKYKGDGYVNTFTHVTCSQCKQLFIPNVYKNDPLLLEIQKSSIKDKYKLGMSPKISMQYYPFTPNCPIDGKLCYMSCEEYFQEKCLMFEMDKLLFNIFNYTHIISFGEFPIYLMSGHWMGKQKLVGFGLSCGDNIILEKIMKELRIPIECKFPVSKNPKTNFNHLKQFEEWLNKIKKNKTKIINLYNIKHKCIRCKKIKSSIHTYTAGIVCNECETIIVKDWLVGKKSKVK